MQFTRRSLVLGAMTTPLAAPFAAQTQAQAQAWPSGNVRIVVAYPPGGSTDAIMRLVQPTLQQRLGTTIVIENRSGASGSVGTGAVAKSPPDGNTWLAVFDNHAANPFVLPEPALRYREGSRSGAADRHGALPDHDRESQNPTTRWPMSSPPPRKAPAPSATPRSAAAASAIWRWRCCRNAPA